LQVRINYVSNITDVTQKRPHPKSLSLRARDLPEELPFALREKGLGDEGFA